MFGRKGFLFQMFITISLLLGVAKLSYATPDKPVVGEAAPVFKLKDWVNSEPLTMESLRGKFVVLIFWGSYYQDFHPFIPEIVKVSQEMSEQGVTFIGVSAEDFKKLAENAKKLEIPFPLATDAGTSTFVAYGVKQIPEAFIIDPQGKIAWSGPPYDSAHFADSLRELVGDPANKAMMELRKQLDAGRQLEKKGDIVAAIDVFQKVVKGAGSDPVFAEEAKEALDRYEKEAQVEFERARDSIGSGALLTGLDILQKASEKYKGTASGAAALKEWKRLKDSPKIGKEREAASLLAKAKAAQQKGDKFQEASALKQIESRMQETESWKEAKPMLEAMRADQASWLAIEKSFIEKEIQGQMSLADAAKKAGNQKLAEEYQKKVDLLKVQLSKMNSVGLLSNEKK